jgi:hypothetical protein
VKNRIRPTDSYVTVALLVFGFFFTIDHKKTRKELLFHSYPNTHIHNHSVSWLGKGISLKNGRG